MGGYRLNRLTLGLALAAVVFKGIDVASFLYNQPTAIWNNWFGWVVGVMPPVWLVVAAWLSRHDFSPTRHAVFLAVAFTLAIKAVTVGITLYVGFGNPTGISLTGQFWPFFYNSQRAPALLALTVLVPAAVGWRQRRQERFDDTDGED